MPTVCTTSRGTTALQCISMHAIKRPPGGRVGLLRGGPLHIRQHASEMSVCIRRMKGRMQPGCPSRRRPCFSCPPGPNASSYMQPGAPVQGSQARQVAVTFHVPYRTMVGETISVVGGLPELGSWSAAGAAQLEWCGGHVWRGTVALPAGADTEFKCILHGAPGGDIWQPGRNRRLQIPRDHSAVEVRCSWDMEAVSTVPVSPADKEALDNAARDISDYGHTLSYTERELMQARQTLIAFDKQGNGVQEAERIVDAAMEAVDVEESAEKILELQHVVDQLRETHTKLQEDWQATGGKITSALFEKLQQAGEGQPEVHSNARSATPGTLAFTVSRMEAQAQDLGRMVSDLSTAKGELRHARQQIAGLQAKLDSAAAQQPGERPPGPEQHAPREGREAQPPGHARHSAAAPPAPDAKYQPAERQARGEATHVAEAPGGSLGQAPGASASPEAAQAAAALEQERRAASAREVEAAGGEAAHGAEAPGGSLGQAPGASASPEAAQMAAAQEQERRAASALEVEATELRQQLADAQAQAQAWQAAASQAAAAPASGAAKQRELELYGRLQAANADITALREWIDGAMRARAEWQAQAQRWQEWQAESGAEMDRMREKLQASEQERQVAAAEAAAAAEAHARAAWMAAQLEEQRRAVAAREAEAQELRRKLAAAHAQRPQGGAARGADSEAHREATLREQLSNAQVELSGLRAQVQAELHGRTEAESAGQRAAAQEASRGAEAVRQLQEQGARMAAELEQQRAAAAAWAAQAEDLRRQLATARAQPPRDAATGAASGSEQQAAQAEIARLRAELQAAMTGRTESAAAAKEAVLREAARSQALAAQLQDRDARLAALAQQQRATGSGSSQTEAEELRRRLASAKDSLRAAAQETKAAAAREAELQQELREAREELRASADATAEARRMQSYMEDMARELYDESQRAAALQDRFAALQAAAAGSAGTLRTFEERLEGQYREMEVLRTGLAEATERLLADQAASAAVIKASLADALNKSRAQWAAKLQAAERTSDDLRRRLAAAEAALQEERRRRGAM
eukprot:jgi/Tetstr1/460736/TSEL_005921.t2